MTISAASLMKPATAAKPFLWTADPDRIIEKVKLRQSVPPRPRDHGDAIRRFGRFQHLDVDSLAIVLDTQAGFEQAGPDFAGAEPCQFRAIEIDSARMAAHVLDRDPQPIGVVRVRHTQQRWYPEGRGNGDPDRDLFAALHIELLASEFVHPDFTAFCGLILEAQHL